jgi:hypothetical protein
MKKVILTLAAVLCCASLFVSCKKSDPSGGQPDYTPAFVEMTFGFNATPEMVNSTEMVISYEAGNEKNTVTQSSESWSKTVKVNLPCTIKFGRTVSVKDASQFTPDKTFKYTTGYDVSLQILNAAGEIVKTGGVIGTSASGSGKADKVAEIINKGLLNLECTYSFDKDGNVVK